MTGFRFLYPPECDPAQEVRMIWWYYKMTDIGDIRI